MSKQSSVMIYEFNKNPAELIRISITEFKGKKYISLWIFFDAGEAEIPDWRPSKKGLCVAVDLLDDLQEGLRLVAEAIEDGFGPSIESRDQAAGEQAAEPETI